MNCADCVEKLESFVDRELSDVEVAEVTQHMKECGSCVRRFDFHAEMKRLVRHCCSQEQAPHDLRSKVGQILA